MKFITTVGRSLIGLPDDAAYLKNIVVAEAESVIGTKYFEEARAVNSNRTRVVAHRSHCL